MRSYLPLIPKDSTTHMHGLAVYVREGLHFTRDFLIMFLQILTYVFDWVYFSQCLTSFSTIDQFRLYARLLILSPLT